MNAKAIVWRKQSRNCSLKHIFWKSYLTEHSSLLLARSDKNHAANINQINVSVFMAFFLPLYSFHVLFKSTIKAYFCLRHTIHNPGYITWDLWTDSDYLIPNLICFWGGRTMVITYRSVYFGRRELQIVKHII